MPSFGKCPPFDESLVPKAGTSIFHSTDGSGVLKVSAQGEGKSAPSYNIYLTKFDDPGTAGPTPYHPSWWPSVTTGFVNYFYTA